MGLVLGCAKALEKSRQLIAVALPLSTDGITPLWEATGLGRQDLTSTWNHLPVPHVPQQSFQEDHAADAMFLPCFSWSLQEVGFSMPALPTSSLLISWVSVFYCNLANSPQGTGQLPVNETSLEETISGTSMWICVDFWEPHGFFLSCTEQSEKAEARGFPALATSVLPEAAFLAVLAPELWQLHGSGSWYGEGLGPLPVALYLLVFIIIWWMLYSLCEGIRKFDFQFLPADLSCRGHQLKGPSSWGRLDRTYHHPKAERRPGEVRKGTALIPLTLWMKNFVLHPCWFCASPFT